MGTMKIDDIKIFQIVAVVVLNWLFKEKGMLKITLLSKLKQCKISGVH